MFLAIPNLMATTTFELNEPWSYKPENPPPYAQGKEAVTKYNNCVTTSHAFISAYEGVTKEVRISDKQGNPCYRMHALIVDYDNPLPENVVDVILKRAPCEFLPNYVCVTGSGNSRLIWLFEEPVQPVNGIHLKAFVELLAKNLKLAKWLGQFDTAALANPATYFDVGVNWIPVRPEAKIPKAHLQLWTIKSVVTLKLDDNKDFEYTIPLADIRKEIETQFPNRWQGAFELGSRGVAFWRDDATNPTSSVVCQDGMLCFSSQTGQSFFPWRQILGKAFCDKYESEYVGNITEKVAYDGKNTFYVELDRGGHPFWDPRTKEDFAQDLRVLGYDGRRAPGKTYSEQDKIIRGIRLTRTVQRVMPLLFFPPGVLVYKGITYLNTTTTWALQPSPPLTEGSMTFMDGRRHFPLIYKFLRTLFANHEDQETEQLTALLAWIKYAYVNALERTPRPGQTIVLAGPVGKGKTMFSEAILGGLFGGHEDAATHLVEGEKWTDHLVDCPILRIDDDLAVGGDYIKLSQFSKRLKKYTANGELPFAKKFKDEGSVPWFGRIVVTCNLDADSLRILPDMDISNRDKVSLFKASDYIMKFDNRDENGVQIRRELPAFARFLVDWTIPNEWRSEELRFGIRSFHHPDLFNESRQHGLGSTIELLMGFMQAFIAADPKRTEWTGTASQLYEDLTGYSSAVMREMKVQTLATRLGKLQSNGFNVSRFRDLGDCVYKWRIGANISEKPTQITP